MKTMQRTNKRPAIAVAIAALAVIAGIALWCDREATFPPVGVECFDEFMSAVASGYADSGLDLPPFQLKNVSHFRCASAKGFEQYEITAVDDTGHSFYVHHSSGGMAASGADSVLDYCYQRDGALVRSIKLLGRNAAPQPGSCAFDVSVPANPSSTYDFSSK